MTPVEWFIFVTVMLAAVNLGLGLGLFGVIWLVRMCRRDDRADVDVGLALEDRGSAGRCVARAESEAVTFPRWRRR